MNGEKLNQTRFSSVNTEGAREGTYSVYFGLGHCITLIDDPKAFKVSPAGVAFGALLTRYLDERYLGSRFLDVGTGSGVHSLLLQSIGVSSITGTDISHNAVSVAKLNELRNFGRNSIEFVSGDLFQGLHADSGKYDVILFNPPGWRTPSDYFVNELKRSVCDVGLPIESMFYGEKTLEKFFERLPDYLSDGGRVIVGLNSLVGIRQVIRRLRELHEEKYMINCRLLEKHDFPLFFYTGGWAKIKSLLVDEILSWVANGDAHCDIEENGQIVWSYEIVEFIFWKR